MMYGLTYLYRASDFFDVAEKFQPESVLFTACWHRLWTGSLTEDISRSDRWRMVDCYEFAFMGAFGMGYKLLVLGQKRLSIGSVAECNNKSLWAVADIVKGHALKVWRRKRESPPSNQGRPRDVVLRPGFLCDLNPVEAAFVDIDTFLKDKVPEKVPVVINMKSYPVLVNDVSGKEGE